MNQLFNMLGNQNPNPMLQQFKQFKKTFKGDAKSQVEQMLKSGRISQEQYNKAVQMANQFQNMMK